MAKNSTSPLEELKNLLEDLQAKKSRESLRMPTRATRRALLQADFTPREPDQKTVERHLRAFYREELADLFEKACRRLLFEDEVLAGDLYSGSGPNSQPIAREDWDLAAQKALDSIPVDALEENPLRTVRLLLDRESLGLGEVARVGMSLRPLPGFGVYEALARMAHRDLDGAQGVLSKVYHESPFQSFRWNAATNLGEVAVLAGDDHGAQMWYRINATSPEPWALSAVLWLFYAIQNGDLAACQDASVVLADAPPSNAVFADFVRRTRALRMSGDWRPSPQSAKVLTSSTIRESVEVEHVQELFA